MKKGNYNQQKEKSKDRKELTISEVIIIIGIIVVLIVILEPNLQNFLRTAKQTKADVSAKKLYTATVTYLNDKQAGDANINSANDVWKREYYNGSITEDKPLKEIMDNYFKGGEIEYDVSYEVYFNADGNVKLVVWKEDGFTGKYPKNKLTTVKKEVF